jgi:hypothetical protein
VNGKEKIFATDGKFLILFTPLAFGKLKAFSKDHPACYSAVGILFHRLERGREFLAPDFAQFHPHGFEHPPTCGSTVCR